MAAIDAETTAARKRSPARAVAGQFTTFMAAFSPRTLAVAASFAVAAIAVQAFLLVSMATKPQVTFETAEQSPTVTGHGTFAMVRFARAPSAAEVTRSREEHQAT